MGLFAPAIRNTTPLQQLGPLTGERLLELFGGQTATSGARVTTESALGVSALYSCLRVVAEGVSALPLFVFERLEQGRLRAPKHPVYRLLHEEPNPWMTSLQLREALQGHLCLRGNAFAEIERDGRGQPKNLWPLRADRMGRPTVSAAGTLLYPYTLPDGSVTELPQRLVLHLRGLSDDGLWGYAPLTLHRETIGYAIATQEYGSRFFGNSARPGGVLQAKTKLSDEAATRMARSWTSAHEGLSMAHRVAVLEEGVEWKAVGMSNEDAQYLDSRKFTVAEIARLFRVPPHLIGDVERTTSWGTGIEQMGIAFVTQCLVPWLERWEQQLHKDLFLPAERDRYYPKHMVSGLLRGDSAARAAYYTTMKQWGNLNADEIREFEELNPLPDGRGQDYWQPANYTVVGDPLPTPIARAQRVMRDPDGRIVGVEEVRSA